MLPWPVTILSIVLLIQFFKLVPCKLKTEMLDIYEWVIVVVFKMLIVLSGTKFLILLWFWSL
jgi:hypothetical protein